MTKKGDVEITEIFIVLLLLVGVLTSVWIATENSGYEEKQVKVTDKTIGELIDDGISEASENFYATNPDGDFRIDTYRWSVLDMSDLPDAEIQGIPYPDGATIPNYPVLFDGKYLYEIRGFGAKVFERTDKEQPIDVEGAAIFLGTSETMDEYYETESTFDIKFYTYSTERKLLENCTVDYYTDSITTGGSFLRTYFLHCSVIWGGYF